MRLPYISRRRHERELAAEQAETLRVKKATVARLIGERDREKSRADQLQKQLDDAFGLDSAPVALGKTWQDRREPKMKYDR